MSRSSQRTLSQGITLSASETNGKPPRPKGGGSHSYRYAEFTGEKKAWLREIILEHRVYVPTLSELNDPADGRPRLAWKSEDELYRFFYNGPCGVLNRAPNMTVEEQVREAVILDLSIRKHGADVLQRMMAKELNARLQERWRIYSLSKRYDNMSLWAKYAGNHSGYCLEFMNEGPFFGRAREVVYDQSFRIDINNLNTCNGEWLFCKSGDWRNEEEVRIVVARNSDGKVAIDPRLLTRIILGRNMQEADRVQIRNWAQQREPELTVVSAYYDEFEQSLKLSM